MKFIHLVDEGYIKLVVCGHWLNIMVKNNLFTTFYLTVTIYTKIFLLSLFVFAKCFTVYISSKQKLKLQETISTNFCDIGHNKSNFSFSSALCK